MAAFKRSRFIYVAVIACCLYLTSLSLKIQPALPTTIIVQPAAASNASRVRRAASLLELLESVKISRGRHLSPAEQVALLDALMREGLLSATEEGAKAISRLIESGALKFGNTGTHGEVLDAGILQRLKGKGCSSPRPGYLAICTKIRNQAWAVNEWLAYHKLLGVEHVHVVVDRNEDNFLDVVKPWGSFVTTSDASRNSSYWHNCFLEHGKKYKWIAFIDMDEYLTPLADECIHSVLKDYEKYGGLVASYSLYNDAKQVVAGPALLCRLLTNVKQAGELQGGL